MYRVLFIRVFCWHTFYTGIISVFNTFSIGIIWFIATFSIGIMCVLQSMCRSGDRFAAIPALARGFYPIASNVRTRKVEGHSPIPRGFLTPSSIRRPQRGPKIVAGRERTYAGLGLEHNVLLDLVTERLQDPRPSKKYVIESTSPYIRVYLDICLDICLDIYLDIYLDIC